MSIRKRCINPTAFIGKMLLRGMGLYTIGSTFVSGLHSFLAVVGQKGEKMIFACENWMIYVAMAFAIAFVLFVDYCLEWMEWQKKHPDEDVKFDIKYVIAAVCTMLVSAMISYIVLFFGMNYIAPETTVEEAGLCFIIAFAIAGVVTYLADSCIFKPVTEGVAASAKVKSQKAIREALASKEAQEAFLKLITDKANALGLVSEAKIKALQGMVADKGADDPNFPMYVQMLLNMPEQ